MRLSTYEKLRTLSKETTGYTNTPILLKHGITNRQIAALTAEGRLEKISHGIYWIPDEGRKKPERYKAIEVCLVDPEAVVCAESACYYMGLIDVEPESLSIATRRDDRHKMDMPFPISRHYYAINSFFDHSKIVPTPFGSYRIYDLDRSVCDCIRFRSEIDPDLFQLILENYQKCESRRLDRLHAYAKIIRAERSVKSLGLQ